LHGQLTERHAVLWRTARTADCYQFYALPGTVPPKPGLLRVAAGKGGSIEVEVWEMGPAEFGTFVALVPSPLVIGTVLLDDGTPVKGFLVEPYALEGARDITSFGGWRAYLASLPA
jgi:allophanate hydrolase